MRTICAALAAVFLLTALTACGGAPAGSGASQPASAPASAPSSASASAPSAESAADSGEVYLKSITSMRGSELNRTLSYRYDENGAQVETTDDIPSFEQVTTTVVTLDDKGQVAAEDVQSTDENYNVRRDYLRDEYGNVTQMTRTMAGTVDVFTDEYEYDDQGRVTKDSHYSNGTLSEYTEYEYDDTHELPVVERNYRADGEPTQTVVRDFDSLAAEGLYVETTTKYRTAMGEERDMVCRYRLEDGQLVYKNDATASNSLYELTYEYDDQGNVISTVGAQNNMEVDLRYEYTYDEAGNILTCTTFNKGEEFQVDTYEYAPLSEVLYTA